MFVYVFSFASTQTQHAHTPPSWCSFSRQKVLNNPSQDRDLELPSYLFFGLDPDDTAAFNDPLTFHDFKVPIVSEQQVSFNMVRSSFFSSLYTHNIECSSPTAVTPFC